MNSVASLRAGAPDLAEGHQESPDLADLPALRIPGIRPPVNNHDAVAVDDRADRLVGAYALLLCRERQSPDEGDRQGKEGQRESAHGISGFGPEGQGLAGRGWRTIRQQTGGVVAEDCTISSQEDSRILPSGKPVPPREGPELCVLRLLLKDGRGPFQGLDRVSCGLAAGNWASACSRFRRASTKSGLMRNAAANCAIASCRRPA